MQSHDNVTARRESWCQEECLEANARATAVLAGHTSEFHGHRGAISTPASQAPQRQRLRITLKLAVGSATASVIQAAVNAAYSKWPETSQYAVLFCVEPFMVFWTIS